MYSSAVTFAQATIWAYNKYYMISRKIVLENS
jgi:hypothetical protein